MISARSSYHFFPAAGAAANRKDWVAKVLMLGTFLVAAGCAPRTLEPPYPKSTLIPDVRWSPVSEIVRLASGSDGWAVAAIAPDRLFTAYADGNGFEPKTDVKLSLGFASVSGSPPKLAGSNFRSASGEQFGHGNKGKKASSALYFDGVLYLLVRNANRKGRYCQLATSSDLGVTWDWQDWQFTELGYCTFLDYGLNYVNALGDYVYIYSHDGNSAYVAADAQLLLRVPSDSLRDQSAYEFFAGIGEDDQPNWSSRHSDRQPVFENTGLSLRSSVSYNAALNRYFWWQQLAVSGSDTRFSGGFGIYESPNPWGPWRTVYFSPEWDVGPGESGKFPVVWMSEDGLQMYLLFSGDDHFSVRRLDLTVVTP